MDDRIPPGAALDRDGVGIRTVERGVADLVGVEPEWITICVKEPKLLGTGRLTGDGNEPGRCALKVGSSVWELRGTCTCIPGWCADHYVSSER